MEEADRFCPKDQEDWRNWLKENHEEKDFVWLIINKKGSPNPNLIWSEAVDQALCFGWIDSTVRPIDDHQYRQYFCKRKPKSHWSRVNKEKVKTLIEQGLMQEAGFKSIEIAKKNGSWTFLDAVEALEVPEDLQKEFAKYEAAREYFDGLSNSMKKQLLFWVVSGKRKETRQKRVSEIAEHASRKMKPKQFR
jgi:uncharacterized protein YdeI (YjbR/CyaY-like superfamily)